MPRVKITDADGEQHEIACPGVDAGQIDKTYLSDRVAHDIDTVDAVIREDEDRLEALEQATGINGAGKKGIASRLDEIEDRLSNLEG